MKNLRILSTTYLMEKRPLAHNISRRNVCVTSQERYAVKPEDRVVLRVYNKEILIGEYTFSGHEFHQNLIERKKTRNGNTIKFLTLGY